MALRFYHTLTQQVQPFVPVDPNAVRMYTCGPTLYGFAHIGNFRTFVFYDLLRRVLRHFASGTLVNGRSHFGDVFGGSRNSFGTSNRRHGSRIHRAST
jgi:cysteinyl-tRNA synthetase